MTEINFDTEMEFAREFWNKAIEGLDEKDYPPKPDEWIEYAPELKSGWEQTKLQLIGMCEAEETSEEQKEDIESFLKCTLSLYVDLMCSISEQFEFAKPLDIPKMEIMDVVEMDELEVN